MQTIIIGYKHYILLNILHLLLKMYYYGKALIRIGHLDGLSLVHLVYFALLYYSFSHLQKAHSLQPNVKKLF